MALIICPECKKPVSDKADACPHCGYKLEEGKKEKAKKGISPFEFFLIIVVALYLIYLFVTIGKIRKDDSTSEGNEYSIENYNTEKNEITSSSEVVVSSEQDALKKYNASIKSVETNGTAKKSITIQIPDQLSEKQIKEIATYLRNENDIYDRLFIFYLLPDMKEGSGAWATSHYNKNLEIKIMGIDKEAEEKLKNINFEGEGEVIGKWYDNTPYIEHTLIITKINGKYKLKRKFKDGSEDEKSLQFSHHNGITKYIYKSDVGEYLLLENDGRLSYYDKYGLINTCDKIK